MTDGAITLADSTDSIKTGTMLQLTLAQALVMALKSNPGLSVEQHMPILAALYEEMERGVFDPELIVDLNLGQDRFLELDTDTGAWSLAKERMGSASVGISQPLPSGTQIEAGLTHTVDNEYDRPEQQEFRVGITVTQALLKGFGPAVNLASVRQAALDTQISLNELKGFTEALLADTELAYWDHVLAREEINIFEKSLEVANKQLSEVEQRIEVGTLPPIESEAARAESALREQALIEANGKLEESRLRLLYYLQPETNNPFALKIETTTEAISNPEPPLDIAKRFAIADRLRSDLQEALLRLKQQRLDIVRTRNGLLPRLDLFINLGKSGYADSFSKAFKALDDDTYDVSAGILFSKPFGNRSAQGEAKAAKISLKQAQESLKNLKQLIHRDILIALNDVDRAWRQIFATQVTRLHQEGALEAEQERFEVGASTGLLVAQVQRDLLSSHIREITAVIGYRKALVKLYLAEGSLMERRGISMPPALSIPED